MPTFNRKRMKRCPRIAKRDNPRIPGTIQITLSGNTVQKILKLLLPPAHTCHKILNNKSIRFDRR
jgi:hypothetical protein